IGAIGIGVKTKEGIVMVAEKRLPNKLIVSSSLKKIWKIDDHIFMCSSGLTPDATKLYELALDYSFKHFNTFGEPISVSGIAKILSEEYGKFAAIDKDSKSGRVYGCSLLLGGYDAIDRYRLYYLNPSGSYVSYYGKSIGSGSLSADLDLKTGFDENMSFEDATKMVLTSLKSVMEEEIAPNNIDIGMLNKEGLKIMNEEEKKHIIETVL
ncbi:MAG: hypothetical protein MHPSP_002118, partial [Paramarteilia canceri]